MVTTVVVIAIIVAIWFILTLILAKKRYNKASQIRNNAYREVQNFTRAYSSNQNLGGKSLQYPSTMGVEMAKKEDPKKKTKSTSTKSHYSGNSGDYGSVYADYGSSNYGSGSSSYDSGSSSSSSDSGSSGGGCD